MTIDFVEIPWRERTVRIEHEFLQPRNDVAQAQPLIVFLHEGLGSRSMWRDFPQRLCDAVGARGLVWSRPGYGRSTPRAADERWGLDFMHRQADEVLPALLDALDITGPVWLFGHSDGGSISLLHAAHHPQRVAGAVVLAPHILVEEFGLISIRKARVAYESTDLRSRLARHHDDVDSAFRGWNDIWLHPDFPTWTIEAELPAIACPLLAVQGLDDPYGTLEQIRGIARARPSTPAAPTELLELPDCGHDPQRDQPDALIAAVQAFMARCR